MKFVLVGQPGFFNRGCEAIVRTTVALLRQRFGEPEVVLASYRPREDGAHEAARGLTVIEHNARRGSMAWTLGAVAQRLLRNMPLSVRLKMQPAFAAMRGADAVLCLGGDGYSTAYGYPGRWLALTRAVRRDGTPYVIWGASIGPFPPGRLERWAAESLRCATLITVREAMTADYLRGIGVTDNVVQAADTAFLLQPEETAVESYWPEGDGVLGLNLSKLVGGYHPGTEARPCLEMAEALISEATDRLGVGVLLIPHVLPDDLAFMRALLRGRESDPRVRMAPANLNACQTKSVIGMCRFLVAARTHAQIAGLSMGVPTLALAYSPKAPGIVRDVFGHGDWVVDSTQPAELARTVEVFRDLVGRETEARDTLRAAVPVTQERARSNVEHLAGALGVG